MLLGYCELHASDLLLLSRSLVIGPRGGGEGSLCIMAKWPTDAREDFKRSLMPGTPVRRQAHRSIVYRCIEQHMRDPWCPAFGKTPSKLCCVDQANAAPTAKKNWEPGNDSGMHT